MCERVFFYLEFCKRESESKIVSHCFVDHGCLHAVVIRTVRRGAVNLCSRVYVDVIDLIRRLQCQYGW